MDEKIKKVPYKEYPEGGRGGERKDASRESIGGNEDSKDAEEGEDGGLVYVLH